MNRHSKATRCPQVEPLECRLALSTLALIFGSDVGAQVDLETGGILPDLNSKGTEVAASTDLAFFPSNTSTEGGTSIGLISLFIFSGQGSTILEGTSYDALDYEAALGVPLSPKPPGVKGLTPDMTLLIRTNDGHLFKAGDFVATGLGTGSVTLAFEYEELKPTPQGMLTGLIEQVDNLPVQVQSVSGKLDAAFAALTAANAETRHDATNHLNAFINAVTAQRGKKFSVADADALIASARGILATIES